MKFFKQVYYTDGGPNDRGQVVDYKVINNFDPRPVNTNNFEVWEQISEKEYYAAKERAQKQLDMFKY